MKTIDSSRLMHICAEEAQQPETARDYEDFLSGIADSVDAITKTVLLGLELYEEARAFFGKLSQGKRPIPRTETLRRITAKYIG